MQNLSLYLKNLNLETMSNWRNTLNVIKKDILSNDTYKIPKLTEEFIKIFLNYDIPWTAETPFEYDVEAYRQNINAISSFFEDLPRVLPKDSFSIKNELSSLLDKLNIPINNLFICNGDVVNGLLRNGHHQIAKDLRELGLVFGNSQDEQDGVLTEPNKQFFILDTNYYQNIEIYSEWLNQIRVDGEKRSFEELEYFLKMKNYYGKTKQELEILVKNPNLISKQGASLLSYAVFSLMPDEWEVATSKSLEERFKQYKKIWKHHGYKDLDEIYYELKSGTVTKNLTRLDFFQGMLLGDVPSTSMNMKKKSLRCVIMQHVKPYWFTNEPQKLVFDYYVKKDEHQLKSEVGYNNFIKSFLNISLEDLKIKDLFDKSGNPVYVFSLLRSLQKGIVKFILNEEVLKEISTEKEANIFFDKLALLSNEYSCYVSYYEKVFHNRQSILNTLTITEDKSTIKALVDIYNNSNHILSLSSKPSLYYESLGNLILEEVVDYSKFLNSHLKIEILDIDINNKEDFKNLLIKNFSINTDSNNPGLVNLEGKFSIFSHPVFKNKELPKYFIEAIKILDDTNQVDIKTDVFLKIEKVLDKIESCFEIIREIINDNNKAIDWGSLKPIIAIIEDNYLNNAIPSAKIEIKNKIKKF